MHYTGAEMTTWVVSLMWPVMRIGGMFVAAPIFAARTVSVRIRVLLSFAIAWLLVPVIPEPPNVDLISAEAVIIGINQVLIGVGMGFILQLVFAAFVIAGTSIAMSMGLGFALMVDPNGVQVPVISQALLIMATLVFLSLNGHLLLIEVLANSFHNLPVGMFMPTRDGFWQIANWGTNMFAGAVMIALPAVATLLLVNLAFGVTTKAAPQLNIFAVGFPLMIMVGLIFLILILPTITDHLSRLLTEAFELMGHYLAAA